MGLNPRETSLEYGIFGAEPWTEEMRVKLESELGLKAIDIYGLSEVIGPGVSIECFEAQNGLHIAEDHFLAEVIDPLTGEVLPYGVQGELVFTSLTKEAFPVIRYRTGDLASLHPEKCACGRTTLRMSRIKGRIDDMLIIRGVNVYPTEIESVLLGFTELAPHYKVVIEKEGALDRFEVHGEGTHEFFGQHAGDAKGLEKTIMQKLKDALGITVHVVIHPPGSIPRSEGKAIRIEDNRNKVKV
jgi:phenylacetate-CoA ligase